MSKSTSDSLDKFKVNRRENIFDRIGIEQLNEVQLSALLIEVNSIRQETNQINKVKLSMEVFGNNLGVAVLDLID